MSKFSSTQYDDLKRSDHKEPQAGREHENCAAQLNLKPSDLPPGTVKIDAVSKRFRKVTSQKKSYSTLKSSLLSFLQRNTNQDLQAWTTALDNVSLEIAPGASFGIIGRNGSGKSSLLKLIAGIYRADKGSVRTAGKISALIELGAGFHPDFTGRENVYLGGIMYGLNRKQIDNCFDQIVKYAELEDFIDDPVRTYSSGMYMRLGFSLAVHTDPDILLVDEVLSVGDAAFISRCKDTISELRRRGKTLIFVTHDLSSVVRWCDEVVWLHKGCIRDRGEPKYIVDSYLAEVAKADQRYLKGRNKELGENTAYSSAVEALYDQRGGDVQRWGSGDVEITDVEMFDMEGRQSWVFDSEDGAVVKVSYTLHRPVEELVFGIGILGSDGLDIHGVNTDLDGVDVPLPERSDKYPIQGSFSYRIDRLGLVENSYYLDVAAHRDDGFPYDYHHRLHAFSTRSSSAGSGVYAPPHSWEFNECISVQGANKSSKRAAGA